MYIDLTSCIQFVTVCSVVVIYLWYIYMYVAYLLLAVKFGRMSKKQRERVEDEANFHKSRLSVSIDGSPVQFNSSPSPTNNNQYGLVFHKTIHYISSH